MAASARAFKNMKLGTGRPGVQVAPGQSHNRALCIPALIRNKLANLHTWRPSLRPPMRGTAIPFDLVPKRGRVTPTGLRFPRFKREVGSNTVVRVEGSTEIFLGLSWQSLIVPILTE